MQRLLFIVSFLSHIFFVPVMIDDASDSKHNLEQGGLLKYVFIMDYNAHMNKDLTQDCRSRGPGGMHPPDFDQNRDKYHLLQKSPQLIFRTCYAAPQQCYGPVFEIVGAMPDALLTAAAPALAFRSCSLCSACL